MKQINFHLALYPDTFLWINEQKEFSIIQENIPLFI